MNAPVFTPFSGTTTLVEDTAPYTLGGVIDFTDDRPSTVPSPYTNFQAIQPVAPIGTTLGTLTANISKQALSNTDQAGKVTWSYTVNNNDLQYLAEGQQRLEQFNITLVDADGQPSTYMLTITITGTNDGPTFSTGPVTVASMDEDATLSDSGVLSFTDVDVRDTHTVTSAVAVSGDSTGLALNNDALKALLTLTPNSTTTAAAGSVDWSFAASKSDFQFLDDGDTLTLTYTVTIDDGQTGTASQTITVTITGSNDDPILTVGSQSITDTANDDPNADLTGSFSATDADNGDVMTFDIDGGDTSDDDDFDVMLEGDYGTLYLNNSTGAYKYVINDTAVEGLKGPASDTFSILASDGIASDTETFTISIMGANDTPELTATLTTHTYTDTAANDTFGKITGTLSFADRDAGEMASYSIAFPGGPTGASGTYTIDSQPYNQRLENTYGNLYVNTATGAYVFVPDDNAIEALKVNDGAVFNLIVTDSSGATDIETLTISIAGANDTAEITGTSTGGVTEDGTLTTGGTLTSTDRDTADVGFQIPASLAGTYGTFTFDASTGAWGYTLTNTNAAVQALDDSETLTDTLTVNSADGTDSETISVTIHGVNDGPTGPASVTVAAITDPTTPLQTNGAQSNSATTLSGLNARSGSFAIADVDETDAATLDVDMNDDGMFDATDVHLIREAATFTWSNGGTPLSSSGLNSGTTGNPFPQTDAIPTAALSLADRADILNAFDVTATSYNASTNELTVNWKFNDVETTAGVAGITIDDNGTTPNLASIGTVNVNFLAAGETLVVTFPVTVSDGTTTHTVIVPITFTGTNDNPVNNGTTSATVFLNEGGGNARFTNAETGPLVDNNDSNTATDNGYNGGIHTVEVDNGVASDNQAFDIGFSDTDRNDISHTASRSLTSATWVAGTVPEAELPAIESYLTVTANQRASAGASSTINWTFTAPDTAFDFLGEGETLTLVYQLNVSDGTLSTQGAGRTVTVVITGQDDEFAITTASGDSDAGAVTEGPISGPNTMVVSDTLTVSDLDLADVHTASVFSVDVNEELSTGTDGGILNADLLDMMGVSTTDITSATTGTGQLTWTFTADETFDHLAEGETLVLDYTIRVTDDNVPPNTLDKIVTITITGSNDKPSISVATGEDEGAVLEDDAATLTDSGSISFDDLDNTDTSTVAAAIQGTPTTTSAAPIPPALLAALADPGAFVLTGAGVGTGAHDGTTNWEFSVANSLVQYLNEGETITVTYRITVTDDSGTANASNFRDVTITITGTNDGPTANADVNGTDTVKEAGNEPVVAGDATATGNVLTNDTDPDSTADLDVVGVQAGTATGPVSGSVGSSVAGTYGSIVINEDGTWTYTLSDADTDTNALAANETATETFTYTIEDDHGKKSTSTVTITINGSNDGPVIDQEGGDATGTITEDLNAPTTTPAAESGSFTFSDADLSDRPGSGTADTVGNASLSFVASVSTAGLTPSQIAAAQALADARFSTSLASGATNSGTINWAFTPASGEVDFLGTGQSVTLTFAVTINDGNGGTDTRDVVVTLNGANDVITAGTSTIPDVTTGTFTENQTTTVVTAGTVDYRDPDFIGNPIITSTTSSTMPSGKNGVLTVTPSTPAADGTVQLDWVYTNTSDLEFLADGETRTVVFNIQVLDQASTGTLNFSITITITGTNDRPVVTATDVTGAVTEDTALVAGNLEDSGSISFTDADNTDLSTVTFALDSVTAGNGAPALPPGLNAALAAAFSLSGDGVEAAANNGTVNWSFSLPNSAVNYLGAGETLTVTYVISVEDDSEAETDTATQTVTIIITGTNDAPTITAESAGTLLDTAAADIFADITGSLDGADADTTDELTYGLAEGQAATGTYGTLTVNSDGTYTYVVNATAVNALGAGATPSDVFNVSVTDSEGVTTTTTLTVNVTGANDMPTTAAAAETGSGNEDGTITGTLLAGADAEGTTLTFSLVAGSATNGTVTIDEDTGEYVFTPDDDYFGPAEFQYVVNDGTVDSLPKTVTLTVNPVADADTITPNTTLSASVLTPGGNLLIGSGISGSGFVVATDDADAQGVELGLSTVLRFGGTATIDPADPSGVTYVVPAGAALGTPQDNTGSTADDGWARWNFNFSVGTNVDGGAGHTLGSLDYRFTISSIGEGGALTEQLTFTIEDYANAVFGEGTPAAAAFLAGTVFQGSQNFEFASILGSTFDPNAPGFYRIEITASTHGGAELVSTHMNVRVNSDPVAAVDDNAADAVTEAGVTAGDANAVGNVLTNDSDPDPLPVADTSELKVTNISIGATSTAVSGSGTTTINGAYGVLTIAADGSWSYALSATLSDSLDAGEEVSEVFTYTVSDPDGATDTATLTIDITGTNDAAVVTGDTSGNITEAGGVSNATNPTPDVSGDLDHTDVDGDDADDAWDTDVTTQGLYGTLTISATGEWTYTLNNSNATVQGLVAGAPLQDLITVSTADGTTQVITINITGANDTASISGGNTGAITEDASTLTTGGTLTVADVDSGQNVFAAVLSANLVGTYGTFTFDSNTGAWTYALNNTAAVVQALTGGQVVQDTLTVQSVDGTDSEIITVNITGVNDNPDAVSDVGAAQAENLASFTDFNVLTNDSDADHANSALTLSVVGTSVTSSNLLVNGASISGLFSVQSGGVIRYTPGTAFDALNLGETATITVTYKIVDPQGGEDTATLTFTVNGADEIYVGDGLDNTYTGTSFDDDISGLGGDDTLTGGSGNDIIRGGTGDDNLNGGSGNDDLYGGTGSDTINGGSDTDTLHMEGNWSSYTITEGPAGTYHLSNGVDTDTVTGVELITFNGGPAVAISTILNDAPVATDDSGFTMNEDGTLSIPLATLLGNDTDADTIAGLGDVLSISAVGGASTGTVVIDDTNVIFTPAANFNGTATFTYTVRDVHGQTDTGSVSVTVNAVNDAPTVATAIDDQTTAEDAPFTLNVSGNFADVDVGDGRTYSLGAGAPAWLTINAATGVLSGTPANGDVGTVTVTVTVTDTAGETASDTFDIEVTNTNDAPTVATAIDDQTTAEDAPFTLNVSGNFADVDVGDGRTYSLGTGAPSWLTINAATGVLSGTPANGDVGTVTVTVTVTDTAGATASDTFDIEVTNTNDAPVASPVTLTAVAEDTASVIITAAQLLAGVSDVDGPAATISAVSIQSGNGTLTDNHNGTWTYVPAANDDTSVTFSYTATDGSLSNSSTATLDLTPVNDAPVVSGGGGSGPNLLVNGDFENPDVTGNQVIGTGIPGWDHSGGFEILEDGSYINPHSGENLVSFGHSGATGGTMSQSVATVVGETYTLTYWVSEQQGDDPNQVARAEALNGATVLAVQNTPITMVAGTWVQQTLTFTATSTLTTIQFTDATPSSAGGGANWSLDNVSLVQNSTVAGIPDQSIMEDSPFNYTVPPGTFTDVDDATLSYSLGAGSPGWLSIDGMTGEITGTPPVNFNGSVSVTVVASDAAGLTASDSFNIAITAVNDAPVASPVTLTAVAEDTASVIITAAQLLAGVSDVDGPAATISAVSIQSGYGTLTDNGNGTWTYVPAANDDTSVTFSYTATDGSLSSSSTAVLDLTPVNDAPTGAPTATLAGGTEDIAYTVTAAALLQGLSDVDGGPLVISTLAASGGGTVTNNGNGTYTITHPANFNGVVTLTYTVSDGNGGELAGQTRTYVLAEDNIEPNIINGTPNPDNLQGTATIDHIFALDSDDLITNIGGSGQRDVVNGGGGSDTVDFTSLSTFAWVDLAYAGDEAWTQLTPGAWHRVADLVSIENVVGTSFADYLRGDGNNNIISGMGGTDNIDGRGGNDVINGGTGNDIVSGGEGDDILDGGADNDVVSGGLGNDTIQISGSNFGRDTINGGGDNDTLDLSAMSNYAWIDLSYGGDDVWTKDSLGNWVAVADLMSIEEVKGTAFDDDMRGDGNANTFIGMGGNDLINGRDGADTIDGGGGNDSIFGGSGDDTVKITGSVFGHDQVSGGTVFGTDSINDSDTIDLSGLSSFAWVDLAYGSDEVWTQQVPGTWLAVANLFDFENIKGSVFADQLKGDAANNVITGGAGNDVLTGRGGSDTFNFDALGFGKDTVTDFMDGTDNLSISSVVADDISDFIVAGNGTTQVTLTLASDTSQVITLKNVTAITIDNSDIHFV